MDCAVFENIDIFYLYRMYISNFDTYRPIYLYDAHIILLKSRAVELTR